ncbi:hypothetical protein DICPUDRAFT_50598 [Dictyostelium purpureum]|uniref:Uncharacterized protein n=1 Tax=Dictyostelium purpureum TaxID=5786 RepID=F0ZZ71_DICPU|nr:uncharacterized protein DICPUDRAFT_50598 [Dictyostelium purpureum]EGC30753.1 hypothetical protein DICPUDRAFT_50598 [Dictyostelium purpureum]|eukprot:XP_003292714.1 hypothetical protein DICPUDRAFT_50598 [Dictyostelium purpureum]
MRRQQRAQDSDFLDEQEQNDLISGLLSKDKQSALFYRKCMSYIGFFCGFLKLLCAIMPFNVLPFEHAAHNSLRLSGVSTFIMAWMEWISSSAYVAGGIAMYPEFVKGFIRKWIMMACIGFSGFVSIIVLFVTGNILTTLWITGLNCIYLFGCLYVYTLTSNGQNEIINLQKFQYPHKKA